MKNSLFFVANDYIIAKENAKRVADFFSMRLFDTIEMFEFDHSPRTINEVIKDFGSDYVRKELKSILNMGLEFEDIVIVADFNYIDCFNSLYQKANDKSLVIYLNDKDIKISDDLRNQRLGFLKDACDLALDITNKDDNQVFDEIINSIKTYFNYEG